MDIIDSKPKYIRKKCEHNKYSYQCKECGGKCICEHGRQKSYCKECNGKGICEHNRIKYRCKECGGNGICEHGKRKSRCVECKGGSICKHNKVKSRCKECGGNEICEHGKRKERCIDCEGSSICIHKKRKSRCIECKGSSICEHKKDKYTCVDCHGNNICEHNKLRYQCLECKGSRFCIHNIRKCLCKECDGSYLCPHDKQKNICIICVPENACQYCKSVSIINSRWSPYCFRCYCVLHPDANIPKKFKLKEHFVRDVLKENYKDTLTMTFDKSIEGGCSRRRPDILIDFGSHCLIIEIDENKHNNYICEQKRMIQIYEDIGFRRVIFIRFNPDAYKLNNINYISPFKYTKTGSININKSEMSKRVSELTKRIDYYKENEPINEFTIEYMFYGDNENNENNTDDNFLNK